MSSVKTRTRNFASRKSTDALRSLDKANSVRAGAHGRETPPSREAMRRSLEELHCPWCGKGPFQVLGYHMNHAHGYSAAEVKKLAGYPKNHPLCSPQYSQKHRQISKANITPAQVAKMQAARDPKKPRNFSEAGREIQRQKIAAIRASGINPGRLGNQAYAAKRMAEWPERDARVKELFDTGLRLDAIQERLGLSQPTVKESLARLGLNGDMRGRAMRDPKRKQRAVTALRDGWTHQTQIRAAERMRRFQELGGDWDAAQAVANEDGVSLRAVANFVQSQGASLPDRRRHVPRPCNQSECPKVAKSRGMCSAHYQRWAYHQKKNASKENS